MRPLALACLLACAGAPAWAVPCAAPDEAALLACVGTPGVTQIDITNPYTVNAAVSLPASITLNTNGFNVAFNNLITNGAVTTAGGGTITVAGQLDLGVSGNGSLSVVNPGAPTLLINGASTNSGTTTIASGAGLLLSINGRLGTGNILNNGNLAINVATPYNMANDISGTGSLQLYNGTTVVYTGAFTATGRINVGTGATLQIGNGGAAGSVAAGSYDLGGALIFRRSGDLLISGDINGGGTLTQDGTGRLILTENNAVFSGATTINAGGTIQLGNGGSTGALGTSTVLNNGALAVNRDNAYTLGNAISGSGTLTQAGTGTTTLTGANTYGGTTTISGGVLQIGANGTSGTLGTGNVVNNGTLRFNRSDTVTVGNDISGTGGLQQEGTGTLILTGNNTFGGASLIAAGTLQVGNGGATGSLGDGTGSVTNNAALVFNRGDAVTFTNAIDGTGTFRQSGAGTLTLAGNNTYSGTTTVDAGRSLVVGNGATAGSLGTGSVTNDGALGFNRSDAITVPGAIGGNGTLAQNGSGNLVLSGANTYNGATTVNAGTLSVNGSITSSTMVNSGAILGGSGAVGNVTIAGGGILAPGNSIGNLTVNGNLSFSAGSIFRVETDAAGNADRIIVNGTPTLNGTVDVRAGSGNYARNTSYTILTSTGFAVGTFAGVTSNLAFLTPTLSYTANSVVLNLAASGVSYDAVARTSNQRGVAGYLNPLAGSGGALGALVTQIDGLTAEQARDAFDALSGSQHAAASQVAGAMSRNFGNALDGRAANAGGSGGAGGVAFGTARYDALAFSSPAAQWGLSTDAPVQLAGMFAAGNAGGGGTRETGRAASGDGPMRNAAWAANTANRNGLWGQALGTGGRTRSDGNGAGSDYRAGGFMVGYDRALSERWLVGAAAGYQRANWDASTNGVAPANGRIETPQGALYARYASGPWMVSFSGSYADHKFDTRRTVTIGATSSTASSVHHGQEWGAGAQVEYALAAGSWQVRPLAGLRYTKLREDGFTESGAAGGANLSVNSRTTQSTTASAGARLLRPFVTGNGAGAFEVRAVASHLFGDNDAPVSARLAGQAASFTTTGTPLKRNALTLGAALSGKIGRNFSAYADASYELRGAGQDAVAIGAGVRWVW